MPAIRLIKTCRGCESFEKEDRYDVLFRGAIFDQLYFNMRGYVGYLPAPKLDGMEIPSVSCMVIGERGISIYRQEVARLNREWAELIKEWAHVVPSLWDGQGR